MADTRVFIDDAVLGRLPDVCIKNGGPTYGCRMRLTQEVGGSTRLGVLWLLFFVGPLGWIVLALLAGRSNGERLTVELPMSEPAHERLREARRARNLGTGVATAAAIGCFALALAFDFGGLGLLGAVAVAVAIVTYLVGQVRVNRSLVDLELDASRRWVTIRGVHPEFAAACAEREPEHRRV